MLLTTASTRPKVLIVESTTSRSTSASVTDPVWAIATSGPSCSARSAAPPELDRSPRRYPSAARRLAIPAPMPLPAAVTIATSPELGSGAMAPNLMARLTRIGVDLEGGDVDSFESGTRNRLEFTQDVVIPARIRRARDVPR